VKANLANRNQSMHKRLELQQSCIFGAKLNDSPINIDAVDLGKHCMTNK